MQGTTSTRKFSPYYVFSQVFNHLKSKNEARAWTVEMKLPLHFTPAIHSDFYTVKVAKYLLYIEKTRPLYGLYAKISKC